MLTGSFNLSNVSWTRLDEKKNAIYPFNKLQLGEICNILNIVKGVAPCESNNGPAITWSWIETFTCM